MGAKSRTKGKIGERAAAEFLRNLGFVTARRGAQVSGKETADVVADELDRVHVEVKAGYPATEFSIQSQRWREAVEQARRDASAKRQAWFLLWRVKGSSRWLGTFEGSNGRLLTIGDPLEINATLIELQIARKK